MLQTGKAIFGAVALALTLGAVQFASGEDLIRRPQLVPDATGSAINRAAKADRAGRRATPGMRTQTISLHLDGLSDTSVLVRIPTAGMARSGAAPHSLVKPSAATRTVACEPVVSVLTEVAKQLEPGRCVT
jgi:hypothetical protein